MHEPGADEPGAHVSGPSAALPAVLAGIGRSLPGSVRLVILRITGVSSPPTGGRRVAAGERLTGDQPIDGRPLAERPADGGLAGRQSDGGTAARWPAAGDVAFQAPHEASHEALHDMGTAAGWQSALGWLSRPDLFSVAVVSGYAVDALHLALACDLRVVRDDAYLSFGDVRHGRIPALGVSRALVDLVGYSRALDLCVTGRVLSGAQAQAVGLVDRLVAPAELDRVVEELAAALLAAPRETAVEVKALLLRSRELSVADQLRAERDAQARCSSAPAGAAG
ncbi:MULTISPECIES: enoyl-CoA hydratase/isomerase family protein [Protofrankia]|uniref:enoyl-CoA hydratase/isomerase family protein n=1 Tax=Protofrankia TaxID=2994361 RepID=UPI0013EAF489|nr:MULTISPECIES: enoyl-CoA hydratase/isomerase family protein [Protofrankia]